MLIKARCEHLENQGQIVQDPLKRLNEQLNENDNPVIILNYLKKDRFWDSGTDLSFRFRSVSLFSSYSKLIFIRCNSLHISFTPATGYQIDPSEYQSD